jgi:hypothetical protein
MKSIANRKTTQNPQTSKKATPPRPGGKIFPIKKYQQLHLDWRFPATFDYQTVWNI